MKTVYKIAVLCVMALWFAVPAAAQDGINSTVRVERDYSGEVAGAVKSAVRPAVNDSLLNFKLNFDYTTFFNPYADLYEFSPVFTAGPGNVGRVKYPWLYAELSAAFPLAASAHVHVAPRLGSRFSMGLHLNHDSFWGRVPSVGYDAAHQQVTYGAASRTQRMRNRVGASLGYRWKKGEVYLDADYRNQVYAYGHASGLSEADFFRAALTLRSVDADPNSFYYAADAGYRYFTGSGTEEGVVDADVSLGATVKDRHRVFVRFRGSFSESGVWAVTPTYRWSKDRWRLNAGLLVSSAYGPVAKAVTAGGFLIAPDVEVSYEVAENAFWLQAAAEGENTLSTLYDLHLQNPWLAAGQGAHLSSVPISLRLGFKGMARERLSYKLDAGYSRLNSALSYVASGSEQLISGGNTDVLFVNALLRWKSASLTFLLDGKYRWFSSSRAALMMPELEAKALLEYNLRQRFFITADCVFRSAQKGGVMEQGVLTYYRVPATVDLGVRISYAVNPSWMLFVEGNNLINSKIQYFMGYVEPGVSLRLGLCVKF